MKAEKLLEDGLVRKAESDPLVIKSLLGTAVSGLEDAVHIIEREPVKCFAQAYDAVYDACSAHMRGNGYRTVAENDHRVVIWAAAGNGILNRLGGGRRRAALVCCRGCHPRPAATCPAVKIDIVVDVILVAGAASVPVVPLQEGGDRGTAGDIPPVAGDFPGTTDRPRSLH